jgi:hypothetical protein
MITLAFIGAAVLFLLLFYVPAEADSAGDEG